MKLSNCCSIPPFQSIPLNPDAHSSAMFSTYHLKLTPSMARKIWSIMRPISNWYLFKLSVVKVHAIEMDKICTIIMININMLSCQVYNITIM